MIFFGKQAYTVNAIARRSFKHERAFIKRCLQRISNDLKQYEIKEKKHDKVVKAKGNVLTNIKTHMQRKENENANFLEVLENTNVLINGTGTFIRCDKAKELPYARIVFKPKNYDKLEEFINYLEKKNIISEFDIYFFEEPLENIKLTREQNKKEIFINIREIFKNNKNVKRADKIKDLEKKHINSLYLYNIQRYEANEDPSAFLIDKKRLTKEEYRYQYISTILPYICFTFMLFFPHFLICMFIPYIKEKNEKQKKICQVLQEKQKIHTYKEIKPEQIIHFIDNNIKTILLFYNSNVFFNTYMKPLLMDLSQILKNNQVDVNIAGIDTNKYKIPQNILKDFNENLAPLIYFILPYQYDNDCAVLKIEQPFSIATIFLQINPHVYIPKKAYPQIQALDELGNKLKRCIFEQEIFGSKKGEIIYDYGSEIAYLFCMQLNNEDKLF